MANGEDVPDVAHHETFAHVMTAELTAEIWLHCKRYVCGYEGLQINVCTPVDQSSACAYGHIVAYSLCRFTKVIYQFLYNNLQVSEDRLGLI